MINSIKFILLVLFTFGSQLLVYSQEESNKIKKLSWDADIIVTGKVTQKESSWNDSKTRIYTRATVEVQDYLKGSDNSNLVEVRYPGGEVGEVGELYSHMPRFEENEEVLVFLKKEAKVKEYKVLNGEEGKIKVLIDGNSGRKTTSLHVSLKDLKSQIKSFLKDQ